MKKRFLWITDPWHTLDHPKDTTLRLIEESTNLGFENYWCDVKSVRLEEGEAKLDAQRVISVSEGRSRDAFELEKASPFSPTYFHKILYRTDPPIDLAYLHPLQILDTALRGNKKSELINPPKILFFGNEKFEGLFLKKLFPPSVVSARWEDLARFGKTEKVTVCKPLYLAQSIGIQVLNWSTNADIEKAKSALSKLSHGFTQPVMLQRFYEKIRDGEQRLWFLNGKLIAAARKVPKQGEAIINMDQGAILEKTVLNRAEKAAALAISKHLRKEKIRLAAVDLIDGFVTDFNFTSPGLLAPMEKLVGKNLSKTVILSLASQWK